MQLRAFHGRKIHKYRDEGAGSKCLNPKTSCQNETKIKNSDSLGKKGG